MPYAIKLTMRLFAVILSLFTACPFILYSEDIILSANPDLLMSTANDYGPAGSPDFLYSINNDCGPNGAPEFLNSVSNDYGHGIDIEVPTFEDKPMKVILSDNPDLLMSTANDCGPAGSPDFLYSINNDCGPNGAPEFLTSTSNDYGSGLRVTIPDTFITPVWEPIDITEP